MIHFAGVTKGQNDHNQKIDLLRSIKTTVEKGQMYDRHTKIPLLVTDLDLIVRGRKKALKSLLKIRNRKKNILKVAKLEKRKKKHPEIGGIRLFPTNHDLKVPDLKQLQNITKKNVMWATKTE